MAHYHVAPYTPAHATDNGICRCETHGMFLGRPIPGNRLADSCGLTCHMCERAGAIAGRIAATGDGRPVRAPRCATCGVALGERSAMRLRRRTYCETCYSAATS